MKKKPAYGRGQHQLICKALKVSDDPDAPGLTAYEAVCVLMLKMELAENAIRIALTQNKRLKGRHEIERTAKQLKLHHDKFNWFPCYGTEPKQ